MKLKINKYDILKLIVLSLGMVVVSAGMIAGYLSYSNSFGSKTFSEYLFFEAIGFLIFSLVFAVGVATNSNDISFRFGEFMVSEKIVSDEQYNRTVPKIGGKATLFMAITGLLLYLLSALADKLL